MRKSFLQRFIFEKKFQLTRHLVFWVVGAGVIPILFYGLSVNDFNGPLKVTLCMLPVEIIYAYGLLLWLLPKFLEKEKYAKFFLYLAIWMIFSQWLTTLVNHFILLPLLFDIRQVEFKWSFFWSLDWYKLMMTNAIAATAVFVKMFKNWYNELQQKMQAEKEKADTELQLLKAQINPHFLFNTLNNLYSLVYEKSDKAPSMLLRLSGLLSYVMYECKADKVPLQKEITVMKDYVLLEQERYGDRLEVSFSVNGDFSEAIITPLLFQPFIENAFKHGTSEQVGKVWMRIEFSLKGDQLFFGVVNSCEADHPEESHKGGIGINNVQKRLELLYPGRFQFHHGEEGDIYVVSLSINIDYETQQREKMPLADQTKQTSHESAMLISG